MAAACCGNSRSGAAGGRVQRAAQQLQSQFVVSAANVAWRDQQLWLLQETLLVNPLAAMLNLDEFDLR